MPIRLDARDTDFPARFRAFLDTKREASADVEHAVRAIIADVAARGDEALFQLTEKFDRVDLRTMGLRVTPAELDAATAACKPAPLSDDEWNVMRTHPQVGYDLIRKLPNLAAAAEIVLAHHEAFDGSGYPNRLRRDEIPLGARILTIADSYDSMTHPHTQRPAMPPAMAVREIERCSGSQFDPDAATALGRVLVHASEEERA